MLFSCLYQLIPTTSDSHFLMSQTLQKSNTSLPYFFWALVHLMTCHSSPLSIVVADGCLALLFMKWLVGNQESKRRLLPLFCLPSLQKVICISIWVMAGDETTHTFQAYLTADSEVIPVAKWASVQEVCRIDLLDVRHLLKGHWILRQCVSRSSLDNPPVLFVLIIFQVNLLLKEVCMVSVSRNVF